jgi:hypothetical protein
LCSQDFYQKSYAKIMNTAILIATVLAVAGLAIWAVTKGERERKAKKLFPALLFELGQTSFDEVQKMITEEEQKERKDRVRIFALKSVLEAKRIPDVPESTGHFWGIVALEAVGIFALIAALLYATTLIIPNLTFHVGFVAIVTGIIVFIRLLYRQD